MYNTDHIITGREPFSAHYEIKSRCVNLNTFLDVKQICFRNRSTASL